MMLASKIISAPQNGIVETAFASSILLRGSAIRRHSFVPLPPSKRSSSSSPKQ